jgi:hypothetical protein
MARNIRGRLGKLEEDAPVQSIDWISLATGTASGLERFAASLPEPPQPPPARDFVEEKIRQMEAQSIGTGS